MEKYILWGKRALMIVGALASAAATICAAVGANPELACKIAKLSTGSNQEIVACKVKSVEVLANGEAVVEKSTVTPQ
jgi:hypothetical protein